MTSEETFLWIEILTGWALLLQNLEMRSFFRDRWNSSLIVLRSLASLGLLTGGLLQAFVSASSLWTTLSGGCLFFLFVSGLYLLRWGDGPFNGGSDRMTLLLLITCLISHLTAFSPLREIALGYLALQVILSYFIAGIAKLRDPLWRSGHFIEWVFQQSFYPACEKDRKWADHPNLLRILSMMILAFEIGFPLSLLNPTLLILALGIAFCFHFGNAWYLGLNRFLWIWLASYPALFWLQQRF